MYPCHLLYDQEKNKKRIYYEELPWNKRLDLEIEETIAIGESCLFCFLRLERSHLSVFFEMVGMKGIGSLEFEELDALWDKLLLICANTVGIEDRGVRCFILLFFNFKLIVEIRNPVGI